DLPVPLRPTRPTRAPGTICAVAWSISRRPASRIEMSEMESMRGCHRSRAQTQPGFSVLEAPQLFNQPFQPRRRARQFRPQALLQPLAHGLADRAAGPAIDLLVLRRVMARHRICPVD